MYLLNRAPLHVDMLDDDPDNDLGPMSESDRAAAEAALRRRDREEGRRVRGMRRGLLYDDESDDEVSEWAVHVVWLIGETRLYTQYFQSR